ncbi:unnamed protein product [Owenia fusiformis]|uniref:PAS domain-containing protein n=1 Tax=Owenia fusiformis TaxID=6347 RepID=A0A8S4N2C2_OWEFU|nr:unnamed protein product [Owenia fusiformis]
MDDEAGVSDYMSTSSQKDSTTSSSLSLSTDSGDYLVEPSTSGCSSENNKMVKNRQVRKEKVKDYIKELKGLVSRDAHGSKADTLSALKYVVGEFKKIKSSQKWSKKSEVDAGFISTTGSDGIDFDQSKCCMALSLDHGSKVLNMSDGLQSIIKFPCKMIIDREILDFIHERDIVPFLHCLSVLKNVLGNFSDTADNVDVNSNAAYIRLRQYCSLDDGFGNRLTKYVVFKLVPSLRSVGESNTGSSSTDNQAQQYIHLDLEELHSAYKTPGQTPVNNTFSTRHTVYCNFSYIHPSSIPLLGFLPQDLKGVSVFDLYHPDDIATMHDIYKKVIALHGDRFKSHPFRLKLKNGDYIMVETEWSSFSNPWTKHIEFILGQHTVIQGPKNINVFEDQGLDCKPFSMNKEQSLENVKIQQQIKNLLQKPLTSCPAPKDSKVKFSEDVQSKTEDEGRGGSLETLVYNNSEKLSESTSSARPDLQTHFAYKQLNYVQMIRQFLISCSKASSSASSQKNSSVSPDDLTDESEDLPDDLTSIIPIPKPPSFGSRSSTKALVSEYDQPELELIDPSPQFEEKQQNASYKPVSLTSEMLDIHTRMQERQYLHSLKKDKQMIGFVPSSDIDGRNQDIPGQRFKRPHAPYSQGSRKKQKIRSGNSSGSDQMMDQVLPKSTFKSRLKSKAGKAWKKLSSSKEGLSESNSVSLHTSSVVTTSGYNSKGTPSLPNSQNQRETKTAFPISVIQQQHSSNITWPCYPQSGLSFMPQIINGFYHPTTGYFQPIVSQYNQGLNPSTYSTSSFTSSCLTIPLSAGRVATCAQKGSAETASDGEGSPSKTSNDEMNSSQQDTTSSINYLLDSSMGYSSECDTLINEGKKNKKKIQELLPSKPFWMMAANWTKDCEFKYQMPHGTSLLMENKRKLRHMNQEELLLDQLKEVTLEITNSSTAPVDEEADDLFYLFEDDEAPFGNGPESTSQLSNSDLPDSIRNDNIDNRSQSEPKHLESELNDSIKANESDLNNINVDTDKIANSDTGKENENLGHNDEPMNIQEEKTKDLITAPVQIKLETVSSPETVKSESTNDGNINDDLLSPDKAKTDVGNETIEIIEKQEMLLEKEVSVSDTGSHEGSNEVCSVNSDNRGDNSSNSGIQSISVCSSTITPSDGQSFEEAQSSNKESDGSNSSKGDESPIPDQGQSASGATEGKFPQTKFLPYNALFVSNPTIYLEYDTPSNIPGVVKRGRPIWEEVGEPMDERVGLRYQMTPPSNIEAVLESDKMKLEMFKHSDMIQQQIHCVLKEARADMRQKMKKKKHKSNRVDAVDNENEKNVDENEMLQEQEQSGGLLHMDQDKTSSSSGSVCEHEMMGQNDKNFDSSSSDSICQDTSMGETFELLFSSNSPTGSAMELEMTKTDSV